MATRKSGRKGRIYLEVGAGSLAVWLRFIAKWTIDGSSEQLDATTMDDDTKVYVADLPDAKGTFEGFVDTDAPQFWEASQDGTPRKFYLYPDRTDLTWYWFGTINADFSGSGGVGQVIEVKSSWGAATPIAMVHA